MILIKIRSISNPKTLIQLEVMDYEIVNKEEIKLVGIGVRTTNEENKALGDIGALWNRFYTEGIASKITNKSEDSIISLYTDYESDFTKPYTCIVGCPVTDEVNIPEGLVVKLIPKAKYAVFTAKSNAPEDVFAVWQYVWGSDLERTYTGDFEEYSTDSQETKIYIAIK